VRAAATARDTSSASASAIRKNSSSVPESMTSMVASDEGATHSPPMKKRSGCVTGAVVPIVAM
jgi:hypothetical protein